MVFLDFISRGRRPGTPVLLLILSLAVFLVYLPSLKNGFVWDDSYNFTEKRLIADSGSFFLKILRSGDPLEEPKFYRPVQVASFALDYLLWGLNPLGFHLTNALLHVIATVLFYYLALGILGGRSGSFLAAALFAFHPLHAESVNFISGGRNTILCASFMLAAMLLHFRGWKKTAVFFYVLSVFSKEFALLMPFMLFLFSIFLSEGTPSRRRILLSVLPYFGVIVIYLVIRAIVLGGAGLDPLETLPGRLFNVPRMFLVYLGLLIYPYELSTLYPIRTDYGVAAFLSLAAFAALAAVVYSYRRRRIVLFGALWVFAFFLPVSGIFPIGQFQAIEHYMYISSMGFILVVACFARNLRPKVLVAASCILLASYAATVLARTPTWRDDETLFLSMTKDAPGSYIGHNNLGKLFASKGLYREAHEAFSRAVELNPFDSDIWYNMGGVLQELGRLDEAASAYGRAIKSDPGDADGWQERGVVFYEQGKIEEALRDFEKAIELKADFADAWSNKGAVLQKMGRLDKALESYAKALSLDPGHADAIYNMACLYSLKGQTGKAIEYLTRALSFDGKYRELARSDGDMKALRGSMEFKALVGN